jgi:hypothetical protein
MIDRSAVVTIFAVVPSRLAAYSGCCEQGAIVP